MGGSSKPATSTVNNTTTNTPTPYAPAQPVIDSMLANAQTAYNATPKTPTYTGLNAQQLQAQGILTGLAPSLGEGSAAVLDNAKKNASGFYLDPANNPFTSQNPNTDALIAASIDPLRKQLDSNVLSIGDAAKLAGAYGGDRQDLLKGQALTGFNQAALNTTANINYNAWDAQQARAKSEYDIERQNQNNAGTLFQQGNQLAMTPAQIIAALGDQTSAATVAANQSAIDAPWAGLDRLSQITSGVLPLSSTTGTQVGTTTSTGEKASGGASALSGALGGASAGAPFGPWGAGVGAVLGGLGGLFG